MHSYKKTTFSLIALCLVALAAMLFQAPALALNCPDVQWPHETSDLKADPAIIYGRLDNGFGYALMQNTEPRNRVSIKLGVKAGSFNEKDNERGVAHYLEHMAFNGSDHYKPGELVEYFQSIGMRFGNDVNAHTGFKETVYQLLLPDGTSSSMEDGLTVMADYAYGLHLLPEEVERERGVILAEKQSRDSVGYRTFLESLKFFVNNATIAYRMPIGTEEVIKATDQKLLKDFYDTWYRPDTMFLVMVGDFDPKEAIPLIEKVFDPFHARGFLLSNPTPEKVVHKGTKTFYHYEPEAGNTDVSIETITTVKPQPDSFKIQSQRLLETMASKIIKYRLDTLKDQPECPFTDASIGSGVFLKHYAYSSISASCAPEKWEPSMALIEQTLRQVLKYGFTKEEVARVKKELQTSLRNNVARAATRNSDRLAKMITSNVMADEVFMSPAQEEELFGPVISGASKKSLHKAFKKVWPKAHRLVLVTGNALIKGEKAEAETLIAQAYKSSHSSKVSRPARQKAKIFPYLPEPEKIVKPVEDVTVDDLEVTQLAFDNGVRVNIKKTDFKDSQVLAAVRFGSGRSQEPADKPGLAQLAPSVLNESGLGKMTKDELKRALAGASTSVGLHIGESAFFLKGSTIPEELPLLFQLYRHYLQDPAFRQDAYDLAMKRFTQMYDDMAHSMDGAVKLHAQSFLAGMDSRFGSPPKDVFLSLSLEDIVSWVEPALRTAPLELTIVGDLEVEQVKRLAAQYLGSLPARESQSVSRNTDITFPKGQSRTFKVDTKISKALVLVAFPTSDVWDISRTRRLNITANVFSDRLRKEVREKLGLTYSPQAYNRPFRAYPDYGFMTASITIDPSRTEEVVQLVREIAKKLHAEGATEEEVQGALKPSVTHIKDMLRTNPYWLNTVLSGSTLHPQKLEWCRSILKDYSSISKADVDKYATQYLLDNHAAVVVIKSEKEGLEAPDEEVASTK